MHRIASISVVCLLAVLVFGCGKTLDDSADRSGSNYNPGDFKKDEPVTVTVQPVQTEPTGPRDPDGLLYRIAADLHPFLAEVRIKEGSDVLVVFKSNEALQVKAEDLATLAFLGIDGDKLVVSANGKEFRLTK